MFGRIYDRVNSKNNTVNSFFSEGNRLEAIELLKSECADNLPLCKEANPSKMERIRFAAIKMSDGQLNELYYAVDLAQNDWRDLLKVSDCVNVDAHEIWADKVLNISM